MTVMIMRRTSQNNGERDKDIYLYNLVQAQFFLDNGLRPVAVGKGNQGDVFLKFQRDEATLEVFNIWQAHIQRIRGKEGR